LALDVFGSSVDWKMSGRAHDVSVLLRVANPFRLKQPFGAFFVV
jgi:hypothetical protein